MKNNIFNDIFGNLNTPPATDKLRQLKDRMKTTIMKAKKGDKDYFIKQLATDYIRIAEEL